MREGVPIFHSTEIAAGAPTSTTTSLDSTVEQTPSIYKMDATATQVFLAWERLRFYYNVILLLCTFYVVFPIVEKMEGIIIVLTTATLPMPLIWNICFCVGPFGEGYFSLCGIPRVLARCLLFVVVTAIALLLTAAYAKTWS